MEPKRVPCNSSNFRQGRPLGLQPEAIVIHSALGSLAGFAAQCQTPGVSLSAHYGIDRNGNVEQYVEETDTAFHCGVVEKDCACEVVNQKPHTNPNFYTIGITF